MTRASHHPFRVVVFWNPSLNAHDAVPLLVLLHLWLFLSAVNVFDLSTAYENALYSMIDGQDVVLLEFA